MRDEKEYIPTARVAMENGQMRDERVLILTNGWVELKDSDLLVPPHRVRHIKDMDNE